MGEIDHVEGDDERHALARQLAHQHEVTREVRRIGDDDRGRRQGPGGAGERLGGHLRFRQVELQTVETGQVDDVEGLGRAVGERHLQAADPQIGRRTGEVRRLGAHPAQPVEQRRLAGVGIAQQQQAPQRRVAARPGAGRRHRVRDAHRGLGRVSAAAGVPAVPRHRRHRRHRSRPPGAPRRCARVRCGSSAPRRCTGHRWSAPSVGSPPSSPSPPADRLRPPRAPRRRAGRCCRPAGPRDAAGRAAAPGSCR